jgi:hypothetical protein
MLRGRNRGINAFETLLCYIYGGIMLFTDVGLKTQVYAAAQRTWKFSRLITLRFGVKCNLGVYGL